MVGEKRQHCRGKWLESGNCSNPDGQPRVPFGKCFHSEPLQGLPIYRPVNGRIWLESPGTVGHLEIKLPTKKLTQLLLWKTGHCEK